MPRRVDFFLFPDFLLMDLAGPLSVFEFAQRHAPETYALRIISEGGGSVMCTSGLGLTTERAATNGADTLIVVGGPGVQAAAGTESTVASVRAMSKQCRRNASVCTGAFLLAATGLLSGRRATTHWDRAGLLQASYPDVQVDPDSIYIKDGNVWSSAGVTAGIDLALALVQEDLGVEISRKIARQLVVYHRRTGGQSQFSTLLDLEPASDRIRDALRFAREHLKEDLSIERLAEASRLSPRQFSRVFTAETGQTPAKAVERLRSEVARPEVEDGIRPLEAIARDAGFADPERMRQSFIRLFGQPPQEIRRAARAQAMLDEIAAKGERRD
jgi:transcriptional regulator GlxA family with amidase domain